MKKTCNNIEVGEKYAVCVKLLNQMDDAVLETIITAIKKVCTNFRKLIQTKISKKTNDLVK